MIVLTKEDLVAALQQVRIDEVIRTRGGVQIRASRETDRHLRRITVMVPASTEAHHELDAVLGADL